MPKVLSTNRFATHPSFEKIVAAYNKQLAQFGKINDKKFWEAVIVPEIPGYSLWAFYDFLKRARTEAGIGPVHLATAPLLSTTPDGEALRQTMLSNADATTRALSLALNISAEALQQIIDNPESVSAEKRAELFLKVMKAQDSRVKAIGSMRADNRDQERFEHAMGTAAYG